MGVGRVGRERGIKDGGWENTVCWTVSQRAARRFYLLFPPTSAPNICAICNQPDLQRHADSGPQWIAVCSLQSANNVIPISSQLLLNEHKMMFINDDVFDSSWVAHKEKI